MSISASYRSQNNQIKPGRCEMYIKVIRRTTAAGVVCVVYSQSALTGRPTAAVASAVCADIRLPLD